MGEDFRFTAQTSVSFPPHGKRSSFTDTSIKGERNRDKGKLKNMCELVMHVEYFLTENLIKYLVARRFWSPRVDHNNAKCNLV